jgi:hypothetical protein
MLSKHRTLSLVIAFATSSAAPAWAQAPTMSSHNPAVKSSAPAMVAAPAHGTTSFTRNQARGRLAKAGFTNLSHLTKDSSGAWMTTAMKGGQKVNVALDYKGNVTTR